MKKLQVPLLAVLIALVVALGAMLMFTGLDGSGTAADGFRYTVAKDGTARIERYTGSTKQLLVPAQLDGRRVTAIVDDAFWRESFTSVALPDGLTAIGKRAFSDCYDLQTITLPSTVTTIGDKAFEYCTSLTTINLPASVTYIGKDAFARCDKLERVIVERNSFAHQWCQENNMPYSFSN